MRGHGYKVSQGDKKRIHRELRDEFGLSYEEVKDVIDRYQAMHFGIKSFGFEPWDAHGSNIGRRPDGSFVLLDVGRLTW